MKGNLFSALTTLRFEQELLKSSNRPTKPFARVQQEIDFHKERGVHDAVVALSMEYTPYTVTRKCLFIYVFNS